MSTLAPQKSSSSLAQLKSQAKHCEACDLYRHATQTVFGEGPTTAEIVFIGEQPGDQEDLAGRPFVGPAGKLLDRALADAGIDRAKCYVTNAVKHFKWKPRGKRRLHEKPNAAEIEACERWWQAEIGRIRPRFLVCLGATAARAIFGRLVKIGESRGKFVETEWCEQTLVTAHPSSLLRAPDRVSREREYKRFVKDLTLLRKAAK
jgi:uracil-DNA glycosylase family protein